MDISIDCSEISRENVEYSSVEGDPLVYINANFEDANLFIFVPESPNSYIARPNISAIKIYLNESDYEIMTNVGDDYFKILYMDNTNIFDLSGTDITNLVGCPASVTILDVSNCEFLSSFEGCPQQLKEMNISGCPCISSFKNFPPELEELKYNNHPPIESSLPGGNSFNILYGSIAEKCQRSIPGCVLTIV